MYQRKCTLFLLSSVCVVATLSKWTNRHPPLYKSMWMKECWKVLTTHEKWMNKCMAVLNIALALALKSRYSDRIINFFFSILMITIIKLYHGSVFSFCLSLFRRVSTVLMGDNERRKRAFSSEIFQCFCYLHTYAQTTLWYKQFKIFL